MLLRGGSCSSIKFRDLSLEEGLEMVANVEDTLSSGPFRVSRVASCSNRDFNELTEDRIDSSVDSVSMLIFQGKNHGDSGICKRPCLRQSHSIYQCNQSKRMLFNGATMPGY